MSTVNGVSQTRIYIIDSEYRIIYFNSVVGERLPHLQPGGVCYRELCHLDSPCDDCPFARQADCVSVFYNKGANKWLEIGTGSVEWPGAGRCGLVMVNDMQEGNKSLFYDLTHLSVYDELFELNYTRDTFKIIYHTKEKYNIPVMEGKLSSSLEKTAGSLVFSEDVEAFREFWDKDRMRSKLKDKQSQPVLKGQFRMKRADGSYSWAVQVVVPVPGRCGGEEIAMCFIQDIGNQKNWKAGQTADDAQGAF